MSVCVSELRPPTALRLSPFSCCHVRGPGRSHWIMKDHMQSKGCPIPSTMAPTQEWGQTKLSSPSQTRHQMTTAAWVGPPKNRKLASQAHPKGGVINNTAIELGVGGLGRLTKQKQKTDTEPISKAECCHNKTQQKPIIKTPNMWHQLWDWVVDRNRQNNKETKTGETAACVIKSLATFLPVITWKTKMYLRNLWIYDL